MWKRWALALLLLPAAFGADWVPARWPWSDVRSLELLQGSPVNCLLVREPTPEFVAAAAERSIAILSVRSEDGVEIASKSDQIVRFLPRNRLKLAPNSTILATNQGVWPGIGAQEDGSHKSGPTGSTWIDTNTGFLRAARSSGASTLWIGNQPPPNTVITGARYLQAIADAAMSGARWVVAFDADFAARLVKREPAALANWKRMNELLTHFERHPEWREMREFGQLAVVQDTARGALLSGGILDMIAGKHSPVRPIAGQQLTPAALAGATMAVNVDPDTLTPEQKDVLRAFARAGNTLLNAPAGWRDQPRGDRITLNKDELERINDIWRDVNNMIGRRNLGIRLFNVASMLSNALESADGKTVILHLVNYADFPVENVTAHFLGNYTKATLLLPDGTEKKLDIYPADEAHGVDIDKVNVCATIRLER
jgi:hypothetical protein